MSSLHKPLEAVLAERRKRTQGAVEQARADISVAAARATEYESRLREARLAVFKALDARRKQAVEARAAAVAQARERAQQQIAQAKARARAGEPPPPAPRWMPPATASPARSSGPFFKPPAPARQP